MLERLMRCYRYLVESNLREPIHTVTSGQIAEALSVDPTQIRKDFAAIGLIGMGRVGFDACEVCRAIRSAIGFDQEYEGVIVGAGHLGGALLSYSGFALGFARYGLRIIAAFDSDPAKIGTTIVGCPVMSDSCMESFIKERGIRLAILATPLDVSQAVTDRLVSAGVEAIWNFAPTRLAVPEGVLVRDEHISVGLCEIAHHLKR